ncbi:multidrug ABC transporter ATPase [Glaciihabitans sp. UYNi722]|uniref:multidrug ABC transporter ATPase n=1 Tax=Glaciihabitans sp. UYNi722 TaxID=3156344 RepID=UPI0033999A09
MTFHRNERVLAFMMLAIVGLSILAFLSVIIGTAAGLNARDFAGGVWPAVFTLPLIGLPIGFILIIVLLVTTARRRGREAKAEEAANLAKRGSSPARGKK